MGWFTRILSSDKKNTTLENAVSIHMYDLHEWLLTQRKELLATTKLGDESLLYLNTMKDRCWMLECALDKWEEKVMRLGNDPRLKEIKMLFKQTRNALELLHLSKELSVEGIVLLNRQLEVSFQELLAAIQKSSFAENYSFILEGTEQTTLNPLLQKVLEMDELRKGFTDKIVQSGLRKLAILEEKAALMEEYTDRLKHLQKDLALKKERLQIAEARKQQKEAEFGVFQEGPHYSSWKQLEYRRQQLREQQEAQEVSVASFFAQIKPALQKFSSNTPLLREYAEDPLKAWYVDDGMTITNTLLQVKNALRAGSLSLPAEQASFIINRLENPPLNLVQVKRDLQSLNKELITLHNSMRHTDFMMKMGEAQYRLDHFVQQAAKMKSEVDAIETEMNEKESLRTRELDFVHNMVRSTLGKEIEVKV